MIFLLSLLPLLYLVMHSCDGIKGKKLLRKWKCSGRVHQLFVDFKKAYDSGEEYCPIFSLNDTNVAN
jgi:hypothetical protein